MSDRQLLAALRKLQGRESLAASQFSPAQREALDGFARQTGALSCQRQGRGDSYRVVDADLFTTHLNALSPLGEADLDRAIPLRAQRIGQARDSKAGAHQHGHYYLLLKAVGEDLIWREPGRGIQLPLSQSTRDYGAASLLIQAEDGWSSGHELWLVENQALFDRTDWLPSQGPLSLIYYGGQLNNLLLNWLASRPRASRVVHFPDYDGVGLANFARLHQRLGEACSCWLMPDWSARLERYGNPQLWRHGLRDFSRASPRLPAYLTPLLEQMSQSGRALEQEAVWLPL